jgi:spore coat-associated protein N
MAKLAPVREGRGWLRLAGDEYLKVALLVALLLSAAAVTTISLSNALFTDQDVVGGNVFNTGTVSLTTAPTSAIWASVTTGAPGDRATGFLTATNAGSLALRYALSAGNTSTTLAAGINLRVALRGGASCDFPFHNTDGTTTTLTDDTQLYSGTLNTAAVFGSNAQGNQAGDRTLAAAASEVLCFGVVLPTTAANSLQGLSDTATFTFDSEQTANNP